MIYPKISVIMAVYNAEKYIDESIKSTLNQTFKDFEFIIIDDCSTDNSLYIIKKYREKNRRIVLISNKKNIGLIRSLNKGLKIARGKYIVRIDADDISLPDRFKIQFNYLEERPEIFLVGSSAYIIDEEDNLIGISRIISKPKNIKKGLSKSNCLIHPSIMFRNNKIVRYREKAFYCEDYDLYLQFLIKGKMLDNIDMPLIKYRLSLNSISFVKTFYAKLFRKKMRELFLNEIKTGKNYYNLFNPEDIFKIKLPKSSKRFSEKRYIKIVFELNNKKLLRSACIKYFNKYGIFNKILIYYLGSFMSHGFIELIMNLYNNVKYGYIKK